MVFKILIKIRPMFVTAPCQQPVEAGPCNGTFENWYYDHESDSCERFNYGGCKGNKNRYPTEHSCTYHCKKPGVHKGKVPIILFVNQPKKKHKRHFGPLQ